MDGANGLDRTTVTSLLHVQEQEQAVLSKCSQGSQIFIGASELIRIEGPQWISRRAGQRILNPNVVRLKYITDYTYEIAVIVPD